MKIMTFNIQHCKNYITGNIEIEAVAEAIKKYGADIVGLNEVYAKGNTEEAVDQPSCIAHITGMEHYYFAKAIELSNDIFYGNAFLSRFKIMSAETVMIPDPNPKTGSLGYETRCILKARLENGLTVLVTHFGLNGDEIKNAVDTVMKNLEQEKCILMGDFNLEPDNELLKPLREKMKDTAELFKEARFSFPSDKPSEKIDYIFVSPDISVINADIPEIIVSDHRPYYAEIQ